MKCGHSTKGVAIPAENSKATVHVGRWAMLVLVIFCFTRGRDANAQVVSTASINGTIRDQGGAELPGTTVTLTNTSTSVKRTTTTSGESGTYVLVNVLPGQYTLEVTKQGFRTAIQEAFELFVNQTATFNFALTVGATTETVTVRSDSAQIESSTSEIGTVIPQSSVNDLPLNGRNFTQLLRLQRGASPANTSQNAGGGQVNPVGAFVIPAMNGQPNRSNYFSLDGVPANESVFSTFSLAPSVDSIQEFKVESHNDEAQFGGALGAFVNVVTKTGTNQFHGTLWEFLRNDKLNVKNPLTSEVSPFKQNMFGGNIGGPVRLPGYNGRDRTFFFFSYEGFRRVTSGGLAGLATTPTPAQLSGDLSSLSTPIFNPFTTRPDPSNPGQMIRDPFPGNIIPANLIDPNMVKFAQTVFPKPGPSLPGGFNTVSSAENVANQDQYLVRIDHNFNSSNSVWFRYTRVPYTSTIPGGFEGLVTVRTTPAENYGINYLHMFSSNTLLNVQFGHNGINNSSHNVFPGLDAQTVNQAVNFAQSFGCGFASPKCLIPNVNIAGFISGGASIGDNTPMTSVEQGKVDFTKISGNHTFKAGSFFATNGFFGHGQTNSVVFSNNQTADPQTPGSGSALASFLLGVPDSASLQATHNWIKFQDSYGAYFQDQWRATQKLSVNLGIRWEVSTWPRLGLAKDLTDAIGNVDLNNGTFVIQRSVGSCEALGKAPCVPGGLPQPHIVVARDGHLWRTSYDNWQPRVGLAYRLNDRTALRAGFGIFFDESAGIMQQVQGIGGGWPSAGGVIGSNGLNSASAGPPTVTAEDPLSGLNSSLPPATPFGVTSWYRDPLAKNPYSEQWNFGVQRELTPNTILEADYVGSHSSRLTLGSYTNVALTPGPGPTEPRQPFPYIAPQFYDRSVGRSSYNAFQFKLERRARHGLTFLVGYTWSKTIDVGGDGFFSVEGTSIQDPYNVARDRSVAGFDLTHVVSAGWAYEIPRVNTGNRALNAVVNHWQINGIMTANSGLPYDVGVSGDPANTGNFNPVLGYYERLNLVGDPNLSSPTRAQWLNKAAFAVPAPFTFGTMGRNALRGDGFFNLDLSLFKDFPITETKRFEFRAEAFNFTNTPTWGLPGRVFNNPNFGVVTSTQSVERQIQFALKLYF